MGLIKRYIRGASPEARDRIIEQQGWTSHVTVNNSGERCVIGVVMDTRRRVTDSWDVGIDHCDMEMVNYTYNFPMQTVRGGADQVFVAGRFNKAFGRWGYKFIRMLKAEAARGNNIVEAQLELIAG